MNNLEYAVRSIKDKAAGALGELEEACTILKRKEGRNRLSNAAAELHQCANELQNILMRIKTR